MIQHLFHTAEDCHICERPLPSQAYIICVNDGEAYPLDLPPDIRETGRGDFSLDLRFGHDEVSGTSISIIYEHGKKEGCVTIQRKTGTADAQQMGAWFCTSCIYRISEAVDDCPVKEIVLFDADKDCFYPISCGAVKIGDHDLQIRQDGQGYAIMVSHKG